MLENCVARAKKTKSRIWRLGSILEQDVLQPEETPLQNIDLVEYALTRCGMLPIMLQREGGFFSLATQHSHVLTNNFSKTRRFPGNSLGPALLIAQVDCCSISVAALLSQHVATSGFLGTGHFKECRVAQTGEKSHM